MLQAIMDDADLCQFLPLCTVAYVENLITYHFQEYIKIPLTYTPVKCY